MHSSVLISKEELRSSLLSTYSLAPEMFINSNNSMPCFLNHSTTDYLPRQRRVENGLPNFNKLISLEHPKHVYMYFMDILINTPGIIPEEERNSVIARQVRSDPKRRLSEPPARKSSLRIKYKQSYEEGQVSQRTIMTGLMDSIANELTESSIERNTDKKKSRKSIDLLSNETDIRRLVELKMRKLDKFNYKYSNRHSYCLIKKYNLTSSNLFALVRLQKFLKRKLAKKQFFKAINQRKLTAHRKNYKKLKSSLLKFEKAHKRPISENRNTMNLIK